MDDLTDPRRAGGDVAGPGGPNEAHGVIVDIDKAVLMDGATVVLIHLGREGSEELEPSVGLMLEGKINRSDPPEKARILNLTDWDGAAGIITELHALALRAGADVELREKLKARWDRLTEEGNSGE